MIHNISLGGRVRSTDNDFLQECRERLRSLIYNIIPVDEEEISLCMVLIDKDKVEQVKNTLDSLDTQNYTKWHLYIIEDCCKHMDHVSLNKFIDDDRITILRTNKPIGIPGVYLNNIFSHSYSYYFGTLFAGVVLGEGAISKAILQLKAGKVSLIYGIEGKSKHAMPENSRPFIIFTRSIFNKARGFHEAWSQRQNYMIEFVAQVNKSKPRGVMTLDILNDQMFVALHSAQVKTAKRAKFRENYVHKRDKIVLVLSVPSDVKDLDVRLKWLLDEGFAGYHNYKIWIDGPLSLESQLPDSPKLLGLKPAAKLYDIRDRRADYYGRLTCAVNPKRGWLRRLHLACVSTQAGVICDGAPEDSKDIFNSNGLKFVRGKTVDQNLFLVRKRYTDTLSEEHLKQGLCGAAAGLAQRKFLICYRINNADEAPAVLKASVSSAFVFNKPARIRVLAASDNKQYEVWWGDYWFKHEVANSLKAQGFNVVADNEKSDVDVFLHANVPDKRVNAPTKIAWIITRPQSALGQHIYFKGFDHLFSLSADAVPMFKNKGIQSSFMPCGTARTYSFDPKVPKEYDFCMIGNSGKPRRVALLRRLKRMGFKGLVYGTGWQQFKELQDYWGGKYWANTDLEGVFNQSKIVIYAHHEQMRRMGLIAQRLMDICAMGYPCLTDHNVALSKYKLKVPFYTTDDDFIAKVKFYTKNKDNLAKLQAQAMEYSDRARQYDFCKVGEKIGQQLSILKKI